MAATLADSARPLNLGHRQGPGHRPSLPALWLLTDRRLADPMRAAARLPRGAAVILRHAGAPERETLGRGLAAICRRRGVRLLVAVRPDGGWRLAVRLRADGLHLPEAVARRGLPPAARAWMRAGRPAGRLLSAAAHGPAAARRAAAIGCHAVLVSPAFPTASHPGAPGLGVMGVARLTAASGGRAVALGGLTARTARRLRGLPGLRGLAAVSALG